MSITAGQPLVQEKSQQISYNRSHTNSGELDVFDAAAYFSGANCRTNYSYSKSSDDMNGESFTVQQKMMRSGKRMSLDIPMMNDKLSSIPSPTRYQKSKKCEKKYKQPNSPGGKLASFLNSLLNQVSSKKKLYHTQSMKVNHDHEIERRKRRSSISYFRNLNTVSSSTSDSSDSKSSTFFSSSSTTKFKTPPHAHSPIENSSKDIKSHSDHCSNIDIHVKPSCSSDKNINASEKTKNFWSHDEKKFKFKAPSNEFSLEKCSNFVNGILGDKTDHSGDSTNFINDEDDGADSDSSSDLFELQNFDLVSCFSSNSLAYEDN
ncbi:hypothetical protein DCAR_0208126 [Daucus carota subsp. sativus]|uniref:Uncharacterized protein n=1 Tax=Daucus carota subsp. sativus TaxID=79200 RepID=A0A161X5Y0_DAUCS|nr:PREDICTED: protein BIG GRAIN 1-like E [Daucus carota subsp. sativus]WOG88891.1 hypothetical protein DCAR_0208126 [Daucus carota subsp. sativus]